MLCIHDHYIDLFLIKQNKKSEISVNKKTINKNRKHVIDFLKPGKMINNLIIDKINKLN